MRPQGLIDVLSQQGYFFFQITYLRGTGFLRSFESARNSTGKLPSYAYRSPRTATIGTNSIGVTKRQTPSIRYIYISIPNSVTRPSPKQVSRRRQFGHLPYHVQVSTPHTSPTCITLQTEVNLQKKVKPFSTLLNDGE